VELRRLDSKKRLPPFERKVGMADTRTAASPPFIVGLDTPSIKFLCAAKSLGVDFARTVMIGRQAFFPKRDGLSSVLEVLKPGCPPDPLFVGGYSESFFKLLGAETVDSIDLSDFEGATLLHDMNQPLPAALRGRFTAVHDGGTLEHIFNIPQALRNCMELVSVGGHFTQVNAANNFMGHGFWQLSPELLFRVFSPENGFEITTMLLHEVTPTGGWYEVQDPNKAQSRVELCNSVPTYILTVARKIADVTIFALPPQQSDYQVLWDMKDPAGHVVAPLKAKVERGHHSGLLSGLHALPSPLRHVLKGIRRGFFPRAGEEFNRPYFRKLNEAQLLRGVLH